ncbi:Acetyltransferase [Vulgatibacter incomptus]|uniref:Acetyltransferase n=2 Tax=Vulgatibacter incomptus TaxID=1391653 RepID=A0A0K1PIE7_9BACT|nr:Acetyltransferase [Vulgatibacter incomptus]
MALAESTQVAGVLDAKLPGYPMPVALIGRLAVDQRAQGRRVGERLLLDALRRIVDASAILGCIGVVVDAKTEDAARFYSKYDFVSMSKVSWPRRMFLPIGTARGAFSED